MRSAARLLDTELRRFFARRAIRWLFGLGLLVALIVNVVQLARSSDQQVLRPAFVVGADVPTVCRRGTQDGVVIADARCVARNSGGAGVGVGGFGREGPPPQIGAGREVTRFLATEDRDRTVRVGRTFEETIRGMGVALVLLAVVMAATFLAAEFASNGLSTQLLYEPRRWWLYLAKVAAVGLGGAIVAVALVAWTGLGQYVASALRGSTAGVDAGWVAARAGDALRVGAAVALAASVSLAITAIARRTTVAVAVFFGQMIAVGFLANTSWGEGLARVSPINVLWALAFGHLGTDEFAGLHTVAGAAALAVLWAIGATAVGGAWLASREIR